MNRTEAARLAGFKWPSRVAYQLEQSPKIIARIRNERNKLYQTELASQSVETLRDVMSDPEAPASARVAAARTALELAGDIGKHSQANRNQDRNLAEMTPEELAAFIGHWEGERAKMAKDITPSSVWTARRWRMRSWWRRSEKPGKNQFECTINYLSHI